MLSTFSDGVPVDCIETEKSRLVLQELEPGWWVLASIDLTRLPATAKRDQASEKDTKEAYEYSSREVTPSNLMLVQLQQAHSIFLLHHAASLDELYTRLGREQLYSILERYWNRFVLDWDVLLHGNPAVGIYNATKLAGGGELGIGVGEEEWGSGEREVLEDFIHRTEGLTDIIVGRYGDAPGELGEDGLKKPSSGSKDEKKQPEPWLGIGDHPRASDGVIFSGQGALSTRSLATVSQWMEAIFKHGEHAFGIGENPTSRPRHRRKRRKQDEASANGHTRSRHGPKTNEPYPRVKSPRGRAPDYRRKAIENNATPPGIPPPLVGSVERSLNQATTNVQKRDDSQDLKGEIARDTSSVQKTSEEDSSYFDAEKMMGFLKLGYGSAWTLNPKGFGAAKADVSDSESTSTSQAKPPPDQQKEPEEAPMQELDPTPDISETEEEDAAFVQRLEQSIGKFLVGLTGDLENPEFDGDPETEAQDPDSLKSPSKQQRIIIRTLNAQLSARHQIENDGSSTLDQATKVRVAVYTHQPFIFLFLFDLQTPSLTIPSFYRSIHHQLGPLQKPLLRSTDPSRTPERIVANMDSKVEIANSNGLYDLVYDPVKLTVRTSIPNIPVPGTLAAEGILTPRSPSAASARTVSGAWYTLGIPVGSTSTPTSASPSPASTSLALDDRTLKTDWTRIEALNLHSQLLATYTSTRPSSKAPHSTSSSEIERTVKTARGWWVVYMRVPRVPSAHGRASESGTVTPTATATAVMPRLRKEETDENVVAEMGGGETEAFLVRRGVEIGGKEVGAGNWLSRDFGGSTGRSAGGGGGVSARGVVEGVGVDARRWVEGLGRLS